MPFFDDIAKTISGQGQRDVVLAEIAAEKELALSRSDKGSNVSDGIFYFVIIVIVVIFIVISIKILS